MWIYYNALRQQSTLVPHGDVARQGDNLDITLACPLNWAEQNGVGQVTLYYQVPSSDLAEIAESATMVQQRFFKMQDAEVTFGLEDGKAYDTFVFHLPYSVYPITRDAGNLLIQFSKGPATGGSASTSSFFSTTRIYVEKSVFTPSSANITSSQYERLLSLVGQLSQPKIVTFSAKDNITMDGSAPLKITSVLGTGTMSGRFTLLKKIEEKKEELIATNSDSGLKIVENVGGECVTEKFGDKYLHRYSSNQIFVHGKTADGSDRELFLVAKKVTIGNSKDILASDLPYYGEDGEGEAFSLELHCLEAEEGDSISVTGAIPMGYAFAYEDAGETPSGIKFYWADEGGTTD